MSLLRADRHVAPAAVPAQAAPAVRLSEVTKVYGTRAKPTMALDHVSLDVPAGQFLCVVGASGCGKTTMLNLIAGLERPNTGSVEVVEGPRALLFQEAGLFPWLTAQQNVELALRLRGRDKASRRVRSAQLLEMVGLAGFA